MKNFSKQMQIDEAANFFNQIFCSVNQSAFSYLWTLPDKSSFFFDVSTPDNRLAMAKKAIELSNSGQNVFFGVNLQNNPPKSGRGKEPDISLQTAIVTDIDVLGGTHTNPKKYPPNFDVAKSFLPFLSSIYINSGYGLQAYCLFNDLVPVNDDSRLVIKSRDKKFIDAIRDNAADFSKAVDGVGDLTRVLRVPGTRNYKLGVSIDAPICHIVEINDVRFSPAQIDDKLTSFFQNRQVKIQKTTAKPNEKKDFELFDSPLRPSEQERALAMLNFIPCSELTYEDWLAVGMILKNNGNSCADWVQWSRNDTRFKDGECQSKWNGFNGNGLTIATLHKLAVLYSYSEKDFQRQWYQQHKQSSKITHSSADIDYIKKLEQLKKEPKKNLAEIQACIKQLCHWNKDKNGYPTTIKGSSFGNHKLIFYNDPYLNGLFGRDDFRQETVFFKRAPWHNPNLPLKDSWDDTDDAELRLYLREHYVEMSHPQTTFDFITRFAREHSFHAIRRFLDSLTWDHTPRAETIFIKFLGADDTEYTRAVTKHFLFGAIARALFPGCDFQSVPVLQGAQGIGKSRLLRMLGGKHGVNKNESWHIALRDQLDDSHAVDAMRKGWIVEIEEFAAGSRADVNAMKGVLSADDITRRFAYDRRAKTIKAHWVFIATCNDDAPLRDQTGNRRFLPIKCNNKESQIVDGMTPEYIQQVWAEAYHKFKEMFPTVDSFDADLLRLTPDIQKQAAEFAKGITQDDGMTNEIKGYLDSLILPPALWFLLTREERHKFCAESRLVMLDAVKEFNYRRRSRGGDPDTVQRDVNLISSLLTPAQNKYWLRIEHKRFQGNDVDEYILYGSEQRRHICAAEVFNECFGSDNRKRINRISEILTQLDGWHLFGRLRNVDPMYPDQRKAYWRNID